MYLKVVLNGSPSLNHRLILYYRFKTNVLCYLKIVSNIQHKIRSKETRQ